MRCFRQAAHLCICLAKASCCLHGSLGEAGAYDKLCYGLTGNVIIFCQSTNAIAHLVYCCCTGLGDKLYDPYHCVNRQLVVDALAECGVDVHALLMGTFKGSFCNLHEVWNYLYR